MPNPGHIKKKASAHYTWINLLRFINFARVQEGAA